MDTVVYLYASNNKIQLIPIAIPDKSNNGTSFFIFSNGIFCFVTTKYAASKSAASTARYNANSPEDTGMLRTNNPSVPKIAMDVINISLGLFFSLMFYSPTGAPAIHFSYLIPNSTGQWSDPKTSV